MKKTYICPIVEIYIHDQEQHILAGSEQIKSQGGGSGAGYGDSDIDFSAKGGTFFDDDSESQDE